MNEEITPLQKSHRTRTIFFIACIVIALITILVLLYQNGQTIYDNIS